MVFSLISVAVFECQKLFRGFQQTEDSLSDPPNLGEREEDRHRNRTSSSTQNDEDFKNCFDDNNGLTHDTENSKSNSSDEEIYYDCYDEFLYSDTDDSEDVVSNPKCENNRNSQGVYNEEESYSQEIYKIVKDNSFLNCNEEEVYSPETYKGNKLYSTGTCEKEIAINNVVERLLQSVTYLVLKDEELCFAVAESVEYLLEETIKETVSVQTVSTCKDVCWVTYLEHLSENLEEGEHCVDEGDKGDEEACLVVKETVEICDNESQPTVYNLENTNKVDLESLESLSTLDCQEVSIFVDHPDYLEKHLDFDSHIERHFNSTVEVEAELEDEYLDKYPSATTKVCRESESEDSGFIEDLSETESFTTEELSIDTVPYREKTYAKPLIKTTKPFHLTQEYLNLQSKMSLPRELMLIINDIAEQNCHLLEWEVFGNSSEDMRVVLTWRRLDKKDQPRRKMQGKWKLRQSSITTIDDGDELGGDGGSRSRKTSADNWESKQKGTSGGIDASLNRQAQEDELKDRTGSRKTSAVQDQDNEGDTNKSGNRNASGNQDANDDENETKKKRSPYDEGEYKKQSKDETKAGPTEDDSFGKNSDGSGRSSVEGKENNKDDSENQDENKNAKKKKNPFRKLNKDEKLKMKRNKLQLSFSVDQEDEDDEIKGENKEVKVEDDEERKKRGAYDEGEFKDRPKGDTEEGKDSIKIDEDADIKDEILNGGDKDASGDIMDARDGSLDDEEEERKRKRGVYDEGEYKERSKTDGGEDEDTGNLGKGKPIAELEDPNQRRGSRGAYDEGEYQKRDRSNSKISEIEPDEMRDFDPSKREKFADEASDTASVSGDSVLEKPLEEISADDIKGKKHAQIILDKQREKLQQAVEEKPASNEATVTNGEVNHVENGQERKLTARELREASLLSLENDIGYSKRRSSSPMQKKFLPKKEEKVEEVEEQYNKHDNVKRLKPTMHGESITGWEKCIDCKYNSFCDDVVHKSEYMAILLHDRENDTVDTEACTCNVCNGGAVHNGCVYRELLRLKTEYRLFDKRNLCLCSVCIPFKYRKICLRQELRNLRRDGIDLYYRLTYHGDDGKEGYHPNLDDYAEESDEEIEESNNIYGVNFKNALCLDDVGMEITKQDKIDFRNCIDCTFNGFCDDIRHKQLYLLLLRLDIEEFDDLDDECSCLVCEFKGAAHSGCARREIIRLKYDFLLYDVRNLCYCPQCVPFKYRSMCLRQELKLLRRRKNIDLYCNL